MDFKLKAIDNAHFDYNFNLKAVDSFEQKILLALNTWLGEYHYETTNGFDYISFLQGKIPLKFFETFITDGLTQSILEFSHMAKFNQTFYKESSELLVNFIAVSKNKEEISINYKV